MADDDAVQADDTVLWRLLSRSGRVIECVVRFALGGVEVEIRSDGSLVAAQIFTTGAEATAWAEEIREAFDDDV